MRTRTAATTAAAIATIAATAHAQSLFQRPPKVTVDRSDARSRALAEASAAPDGMPSVEQVSLYPVLPPEPRTFLENDLITIIISERTQTEQSSNLETEKSYDVDGELSEWIDMMSLLELRLESGDRSGQSPLPSFKLNMAREFEGEGEAETNHQVTSRVTARVVEVKPNNTLLIESRTVVATNGEEQVILLSGICRAEDVTVFNTVQSNQMYDLRLSIDQTGEVRDASKKGLIPKVVDALFNI